MKKQFRISEKIYWRNLGKSPKIKWDGSSYWFDDALVYWFSTESIEAERFLRPKVVG